MAKPSNVKFANLSPPESPMSDKVSDFGDGEMLRVTPNDQIVFNKSEDEFVGTFDITNIDAKPITYKIKTTAPEKFRVRPSTGILQSNGSASINVLLQPGHFSPWNRDKFLVMCMALDPDQPNTQSDIAELWKNTSTTSAAVEQHRLKCVPPPNATEDSYKAVKTSAGDTSANDKQLLQYRTVMNNLLDSNHRMEALLRVNKALMVFTIVLIVLLAIATIYILKKEIHKDAAQYCLANTD